MEKSLRDECREKCAKILAETRKDPKGWFSDFLEIEEKHDAIRVYVTLGGPTVWWTFNTAQKRGRLFYHHGDVLTHKNFGRKTYEALIPLLK